MADVKATIQKAVVLMRLKKSVGPAGVSIFPISTDVHETENLGERKMENSALFILLHEFFKTSNLMWYLPCTRFEVLTVVNVKDHSLLCDTVQFGRQVLLFKRQQVPPKP